MGILNFLNDERFNVFFSFVLGVGLICILKPVCSGNDCNVMKAPSDKDFDKYVYKMGGTKCYEFKSEIVECPSSGTIEAFRECQNTSNIDFFGDQFSRRNSPIKYCE